MLEPRAHEQSKGVEMVSKKTKQTESGVKGKGKPAKPVKGAVKKPGTGSSKATPKAKAVAKKAVSKKTVAAKKPSAKKAPAKKPSAPARKAPSKKPPVKKVAVEVKSSAGAVEKAGKGSEPKAAVAPAASSRRAKEKTTVKSPFSHTDHADVFRGVEARKAAARAKQARAVRVQKATRKTPARRLTDKQLLSFEQMLQRIRAELIRQIAYLRGASLTRSDEVNPEEDGTDAFERQLALKLAAGEGDSIFEIDEALERIRQKTYGVCEECGCVIPIQRLKALPFARRCVECQSQIEQSQNPALSEHRYF